MSRILNFDPKIRKFKTLAPKNTVSYHTSPPYYLSWKRMAPAIPHAGARGSPPGIRRPWSLRKGTGV